MQAVFHLGAHATDDERLIRTLAANPEAMAGVQAHAPAPRAYRTALRDALIALAGKPADAPTRQKLTAACQAGAPGPVARLVFSYENFLALPDRAITQSGLYPVAADKLAPLANLFEPGQTEFFLGLLNPAVLIAALAARQPARSLEDILCGHAPLALRWGPVVARMAEAARACGATLTLWCNEDLPLIFPDILRAMSGVAEAVPLAGESAVVEEILSDEGRARLKSYLGLHPPQSLAQHRKVSLAFLEKFARPEALEADIPLPGWTDETVAAMSAAYEEDVAQIGTLEGVRLIAP